MGKHLKLLSKMDDLVVDNQLLVNVVDDEDSNGTGTKAVGALHLRGELALVNDGETSLDFTGIGHGNQLSIITDVNETVLLESRCEHGVQDDGWRWVSDNTWLLVKLLGKQVDTEITMLTGLSGGSDTDDLAWSLLKDHQVTDTDMVAWDGEVAGDSSGSSWRSRWSWLLWNHSLGLST